jgi:hypothetical protein
MLPDHKVPSGEYRHNLDAHGEFAVADDYLTEGNLVVSIKCYIKRNIKFLIFFYLLKYPSG